MHVDPRRPGTRALARLLPAGSLLGEAVAAGRALVELALPLQCGGCRRPGTAWCSTCEADMVALAFAGGARAVRPSPCPPGLPTVWSTRPYEGVVRAALVQFKDDDRRDLLGVLAPLLADAVVQALIQDGHARRLLGAGNGPVFVVPVPSSPASVRRRGDAVLEVLVARALAEAGLNGREAVLAPALRVRRRVADQAGLDHVQRAANLESAFECRPAWRGALPGACCLLTDDILTTGATLAEAARALRAGGSAHVLGATIAATGRRPAPEYRDGVGRG